MTCQCRLISYNKCTSELGLIKGETMHDWGQGTYGKSLYFICNFAENLKLLKKIKSVKKKQLGRICVNPNSGLGWV